MRLKLILFLLLFPFVAFAGQDRGGGDEVLVPLASQEQLKNSLTHAKSVLHLWLNGEEALLRAGLIKSDALNLIFGVADSGASAKRTIFDVLADLQIEYRAAAPCLDASGEEKDGSIYTSLNGDAICVSGLRLAQELRQDDYTYQMAALVFHEASHLIGTSETQAVEIQTLAIAGLRTVDFDQIGFDSFRTALSYRMQEPGVAALSKFGSASKSIHDKKLHDVVYDVQMNYIEIQDYLHRDWADPRYHSLLSPLNYRQIDLSRSSMELLANLKYATCDNDTLPNPCVPAYAKIFAGKATADLPTFITGEESGGMGSPGYWPTAGQFSSVQVPYVNSKKAFQDAVATLDKNFKIPAQVATSVVSETPFAIVEK